MFDEEIITLVYQMGLYHIERGVRDFASFRHKLLEDCGENIKPYILPTYSFIYSSHDIIERGWHKDMTPYDQIKQIQSMDDSIKNNSIVNPDNISIETILNTFKSYSDKKKAKDIKSSVCAFLYPDNLLAAPEVDEAIDRVLKEDKNSGTNHG